MKPIIISAIFVLSIGLSFAQNGKIDFSYQVYEIPVSTFDALGKYLERGGREAANAYSKLQNLPGVKDLFSLSTQSQSGNRQKASNNGFQVEYDPVLSADGKVIDINYFAEIPTKDSASFVGQIEIPTGQPFLINSWSDQDLVTALFVTATVPGSPRSDGKPSLELVSCDLTILKLRSTRDANSLSGMNAQQATTQAQREGKQVYHQYALARSGNRSKGSKGDQYVEMDPVLGADRKQVAINLAYSENQNTYLGLKTIQVGSPQLIPLAKRGGGPSQFVLIANTNYLGSTVAQRPANQLPKFKTPGELVTHTYIVAPDLFTDLQTKLGLPATPRSPAIELLSSHGIAFASNASAIFNPTTSKLIFRNVESEHKKLFDLIQNR